MHLAYHGISGCPLPRLPWFFGIARARRGFSESHVPAVFFWNRMCLPWVLTFPSACHGCSLFHPPVTVFCFSLRLSMNSEKQASKTVHRADHKQQHRMSFSHAHVIEKCYIMSKKLCSYRDSIQKLTHRVLLSAITFPSACEGKVQLNTKCISKNV